MCIRDRILSDDFYQMIVLETSRYAQVELDTVDVQNRQKWFPTMVDELKTLFAIIVLMSQNPKQRLEMYWTKRKILRTPIFSEVMPYKLFYFYVNICILQMTLKVMMIG